MNCASAEKKKLSMFKDIYGTVTAGAFIEQNI